MPLFGVRYVDGGGSDCLPAVDEFTCKVLAFTDTDPLGVIHPTPDLSPSVFVPATWAGYPPRTSIMARGGVRCMVVWSVWWCGPRVGGAIRSLGWGMGVGAAVRERALARGSR